MGLDIGFFADCLTATPARSERVIDEQVLADVRYILRRICLNGVDAIVHLAAISNDPIGNRYEDVTVDINHRATVELARRAKAGGRAALRVCVELLRRRRRRRRAHRGIAAESV